MPNITIHALHTAMSGNVTPLDYRNKVRDEWTAWDWLCALKDGLGGDAAGARYETFERIKEELQALIDARNELPGLTEQQMQARYGRRLRTLFNQLYFETTFEGQTIFTEEEQELVEAAADDAVLDNEADILAAERNARFARFRRDAADYLVGLLQARREEELHPAYGPEEHQARLMSLTAKMYVAANLARNLTNRAGAGYPEIFRAEEADRLAESMLANDENFATAIRTEVIMHDIPDLGLAEAGQPQPAEALRDAGIYLTNRSRAIEELAQTPNQLTQAPGNNRLSPENAAIRLGFLKDVKKELDATGTGYDWKHWFSRPNNSPEYEAVRNEIQRQIDRLEAGLPIGENDRQQMMQVLNAYTNGKESPGTGFGKTRQHNMLRLYAEYANDQERTNVMYRYNRARGTTAPNDRDHIDLTNEPYRYNQLNHPQTAAAQYRQALNRLQHLSENAQAAGRPMNEAELVDLRQNVLRLAALREIMTKTRSGEATSLSEAEILTAMSRIENDPHHPVAGAIAAAGRDVSVLAELTQLYDDEMAENFHLAERYFSDPDNYSDPVTGRLQRMSYPTAAQMYQHISAQLAAIQLPQQGGLTQHQIDDITRLSRKAFALKRIMNRRSPQYHVSSSDMMEAERFVTENTRLNPALSRLNTDAVRMNRFRGQLLSPTVSAVDLADRVDRFANGYIQENVSEAQDFFRRIQVQEGDPPLTEQDKAVMRDRLIRVAAVNNLQNARVRNARFPERIFLSERQFSTEDIEAAMEDVRQNEPDFMNAIEQQLNTAGSVQRLAFSLASNRYSLDLGGIRADIAELNTVPYNNDAERTRLTESIKGHIAELIALHNIQTASGSLASPVADEALAAEVERVKLSDEYLAAERMMRAGTYNAPVLLETFSHPETLTDSLAHMIVTVPVVPPAGNTLGANYQNYLNTLATLANPSTAEGRSMVAAQLIRVMACRQLVLEDPQGMYAPMDMNRLNERILAISTDPVYSQYFNRIHNDVQRATNTLTMLAGINNLYDLKVAQQRSVPLGQPFEDPMLPQLKDLANLRYEEIFREGMNALMAEIPNYQAGVPLTAEQKQGLLRATAQMMIGRQAPNGNSQLQMPEDGRRLRIQELTSGLTDESRELIRAIDRVAGDGARVQDLLVAMSSELGQVNDAVRNFALQTPTKWADDAWAKLQAAAGIPHPNGWTAEERRDLVNTYARMAMMRELAKDPQKANVPISAGDADQYAINYLNADNNRAGLEEIFTDPVMAIEVRTLSGRMNALSSLAPENQNAGTLQQLLALRNLQKKYSADAIVSPAEITQEMAKVTDSFAYKVLTDPRNLKVPAVDLKTLTGAYFDNALEGAVLVAPARRAFVLGDAAENSPEGLRRIFSEELRHDRAVNAEAAEIQHFAELYAVSLYTSDPVWKDKPLPSADVISEQAARIAALPDFKAAMRRMNTVPQYKTAMESALKNGAPASRITNDLNRWSEEQRRLENNKDIRRSDLHYDVRSAMVQATLGKLRQTPAVKAWPTAQQIEAAKEDLNVQNPGMTREEARTLYIDFLASNRLYMRNPERSFFTEAEMTAARQEVEQDPDIQTDLETVLKSPQEMRLNIFNLAPSQYWTEIQAMEEGRDAYLNGPGGDGTKLLGLQTILFSLAPIVEARLNGRDTTGRIVSNDDLNIERNRIAYTEEFISLENALRHNINELDRIKDVVKLPADQFKAAFDKLTDEYKQKYPEAEIPDRNTLGGDYLRAKEMIAAARGKDFANDAVARKQLADGIREIMTIRNIILNSKYDVALQKNTVSESDSRTTRATEAAEEAGKHHINMRLGTPAQLEEKLKDPGVAQQFLNIMDGAEDLRRLYGKKLASGTEIVDPLEQQILDQGLAVEVPSHAQRQQEAAVRIMTAVPGENPAQRSTRIRNQVAALFNLTLHATGTEAKDMPSEETLAEQSARITRLKDFQYAADRLAKDPQQLTNFINKALNGMTAQQMAAELDRLSAEEQRALDPAAEPLPNVMFQLKLQLQNEANEGLMRTAGQGGKRYWSSKAERDQAKENFMHYTAVNRLMEQHPYRVYFSPSEIQASFTKAMNDPVLQEQYQRSVNKGGPNGLRQDLFSYAGGTLLTAYKFIGDQLPPIMDTRTDRTSRESFISSVVLHIGLIAWLKREGLSEENHYAGDGQGDIFENYPKTPEFAAMNAACILDPSLTRRISSRLLPLGKDAFAQEYQQVIAECQAPIKAAEQHRRIVDQLKKYSALMSADSGDAGQNVVLGRRYQATMSGPLADSLVLALQAGLPAEERANPEAFLKMRKQIQELQEFKDAKEWLFSNPGELQKLITDVEKGLRPSQLIARFNEAAARQQLSDDKKAQPAPNLVFSLQRQIMDTITKDMFRNNIVDNFSFKEGGQEKIKEEFLNLTALDELMHQYPNRVNFSAKEIRDARAPYEKNVAFMRKLNEALTEPLNTRNNLMRFRCFNNWGNYAAAEKQLTTAQNTLQAMRGVTEEEKFQQYELVTKLLVQTAVTKLDQTRLYYDGKDMADHVDATMQTPGFQAMTRAIMKDPKQLDRIINELYPLQGGAFMKKFDELGNEYIKKYPAPKVKKQARSRQRVQQARPVQQPNAQARPVQQPNVRPVQQPKAQPQPAPAPKNIINEPKNIINEPKKEAPLNSINIINEPKNIINEPKKEAPKPLVPNGQMKQKPLTIVVPEKALKEVALGQFQHSAGMLERTIYLQENGEIPIKDSKFLKAADSGLLQTIAYANLAAKPEYVKAKVSKDALNAELDRLKKDPDLVKLTKLIEDGHAGALLEGIKKLHSDPVQMNQFLKAACMDPAAAFKVLNTKHPLPAPKYETIPTLPKIEGNTSEVLDADSITKLSASPDSPLLRYKEELLRLNMENPNNRQNVMQHLTNLYGLRQIIASSKDPGETDKDLEMKLAEATNKLDNDKAFQNVIKPCGSGKYGSKYIDRMKNAFNVPSSLDDLNKTLQKDGEDMLRHEVKVQNIEIEKQNANIRKNAEKQDGGLIIQG